MKLSERFNSPEVRMLRAARGERSRRASCSRSGAVLLSILLLASNFAADAAPDIDLRAASIVTAGHVSKVESNAVRMLREEVAKRTQVRWTATNQLPMAGASIVLGTFDELKLLTTSESSESRDAIARNRAEGFSIWTQAQGARSHTFVAGNDARGVLFGVGRLLRELRMERQKITLTADFKIDTAPQMPLRGHQLGYRPKPNSYDGWDVPQWEQYIRDLVVFGCNAIELIPPRSDDVADSPHFPLPQMEMMTEMSGLADQYGLDTWIWYPAMDEDYSDAGTVDFALREWADVFRKLPRVDAVFVPGGDPGHTRPKHLLALLEKQTANVRQFHPRAQMWVSPQSFNKAWMDEFLELVRAEPKWLTGIAYGPQVRMSLAELRAAVPMRYPIRDYPDITHSRHCQYPVPDWDLAFALTEGREVINPRPTQMAQVFRVTTLPHARGFITYSEGCNDDVNKAVWSALGWDATADVRQVLLEYSRYFIGPKHEQEFATGLLALEQNWNGAVLTNSSIETTLAKFRALEKAASPQEKLNWRFQQALYRAYYDAYVRRRWTNEMALEHEALDVLAQASSRSSRGDETPTGTDQSLTSATQAMADAEAVLGRAVTQPGAPELRARIFELAEALFQSIHMQLSVERYAGMRGRGNNLDDLDTPLNNSLWLKHRFAEIRKLAGEDERRRALAEIVRWTDPGPGGFYDDLGDPQRQPHLMRGAGWERDPGFYATPQVGFTDSVFKNAPLPRSWWTSAESLYDATVQMRYAGLDRTQPYKVRVVYGRYRNSTRVRLLAAGLEVHPWLQRECERLEFDLPGAATSDGELTLTWQPEPGHGENGRVLEVAEVWLMRR